MPAKKLSLVIGVALVSLIIMSAATYYFQRSIIPIRLSPKPPAAGNDEARDLLDINQKAIEDAASAELYSPAPISAQDHVRGDLFAPVKIIAYLDYSCEFCAVLAENLDALMAEHEGKIVLAARHFPMDDNSQAGVYALALECAAGQEAYWEMHERMFALVRTGTSSASAHLNTARELDLDMDEFSACLDDDATAAMISRSVEDAKAINIIGTPTLFINGEVYPGALPLDNFVDSQQYHREGLRSIVARMLAEGAAAD